MKNLLLSALLVCFTMFAFSQSLEIYHDDVLIPDESAITVFGDPNDPLIVVEVDVKNISSDTINVMAKKFEVSVIPGSSNMFCWLQCFPPYIFEAPSPDTLSPGEVSSEFSGDYVPAGNAGITIMRYTFFDQVNPNDSVCFYTHFFASTVGVEEIGNENISVSNAYPNPASSQTSFDYVLPQSTASASIKIHNLLGAVVREVALNERSGKVSVNISGLNDGVYFYSVVVNNQTIETKRLIVSR
ncbi:MAG: hypothetical protein B6D64_03360 [Bacteroidetes bacterium 4484_276]|nr:MAG: hypothetical protein B6D64_03360 [Bacteroidetes bacterium 4484_276]OYT13851.1 MAG: hypothetical protein B6I19_02950 [Bacteroidetes bacterium 4572_114]